jgi:hypothetical protein
MTDDELSALALAADPDSAVGDDAVSLWDLTDQGPQPLPAWYMPAPKVTGLRGWRRRLVRFNVVMLIAAFVTINAYGLCNTYGQLHL